MCLPIAEIANIVDEETLRPAEAASTGFLRAFLLRRKIGAMSLEDLRGMPMDEPRAGSG
ncbi:hypothetical protein GCM10007857_84000 [Bradyrhizobium iriomotense]|uniref:Uncharacterized protein n=1 Tax=Bradyrhizobium iriomotense TaxID=441950 RepID=A0ABQ6BHJ4_9BRAD|nr:hypothetical protein GCM10007857_84000 [Bradyrhizobium iriomotense]